MNYRNKFYKLAEQSICSVCSIGIRRTEIANIIHLQNGFKL
jgi:hypothetical protein